MPGKYGLRAEKDVAFLNFFATPLQGFDDMAAACIEEEGACNSERIRQDAADVRGHVLGFSL